MAKQKILKVVANSAIDFGIDLKGDRIQYIEGMAFELEEEKAMELAKIGAVTIKTRSAQKAAVQEADAKIKEDAVRIPEEKHLDTREGM